MPSFHKLITYSNQIVLIRLFSGEFVMGAVRARSSNITGTNYTLHNARSVMIQPHGQQMQIGMVPLGAPLFTEQASKEIELFPDEAIMLVEPPHKQLLNAYTESTSGLSMAGASHLDSLNVEQQRR